MSRRLGANVVSCLSDSIEEYLVKLLSLSSAQHIDIRRSELAGKFNCVPSQINYVLATRFTPEKGYLVESRRGGSGYIRIIRIKSLHEAGWTEINSGKHDIDANRVHDYIQRLYNERIITRREARLFEAVFQVVFNNPVLKQVSIEEEEKKLLLNNLLREMLVAVLRDE